MADLQTIYNLCRINADATWETEVSPFTVENMVRLCLLNSLQGKYQYTHQYPQDMVAAQQAVASGQAPAVPLRVLQNYNAKITALKQAFDNSPFTFIAGQNGFAITWNDVPEEGADAPVAELPAAAATEDNVEQDAPPTLADSE